MALLQKSLEKYFKHSEFRPGQEDIINSIMHGNDTLAVMPTGGGKSLCYQLPAILMQGTAIVISPLIALMKDQVDALQNKGVHAELINSSIPFPEIANRLDAAVNGYYKLLYIAPERFESRSFLQKLAHIDISFVAVDEAHCISEWGHDFRPSYQNISTALETVGRPAVIALTATATPEVRKDIMKSLKMKDPNSFMKGFDRPNLIYRVENPKDKNKRIAELINKNKSGSTIVYCGSRKRVENTSDFIKTQKIKVDAYHGGMKPIFRKAVQERFITGQSPVICATNAFGMGIDKADVRRVIHTDLTLTLEAYYQEAGRAGRDGKQSICTILYDEKDVKLQNFFIEATYPDIDAFRDLYLVLKKYSGTDGIILVSPTNLANEAGIPIYSAMNILENFERAGVTSRKNTTNDSEIMFTSPTARIKEYLEYTTEERREVLEALLRTASKDAFDRYVTLDLRKMQREQFLEVKDVEQIVKSFQYDEILSFKQNNTAEGIKLEINVPSVGSLPVDYEGMMRRKENAFYKLNKVLEYLEIGTCKRNFILDYFGEGTLHDVCGKCSSCTADELAYKVSETDLQDKITVMKCANDISDEFQKQTLVDVLKGSNSLQILKFNLNQLPYYSSMKKYSQEYIEKIVNTLINRRYLEISSTEFRPIFVTKIGIDFINDYLKQTNKKNMAEEEKQFDEKLYNRMVKLRTDIAEHAGVVPRGIVSDMILKKITDAKPMDEEELRALSGISQLFTEKYGHLFVKEINDFELGNSFDPSKLSKLAKDTLKLVEQGLTFEQITKRMFNNKQMVSNNIFEAINEGAVVEKEQFFTPEEYQEIYDAAEAAPEKSVKELYRSGTFIADEYVFKIGYAIAKKELMRKAKNL